MTDQPPKPAETPGVIGVWPAARAKDGEVYGLQDENHGMPQMMVCMTKATWDSYMATHRAYKARAEQLSAENDQLRHGAKPPGLILPD